MSEQFIYLYEAEVLRFLNEAEPSIKLLTYAKEDEMFNALAVQTKFPAALYYREADSWEPNKFLTIRDGSRYITFAPIEQNYTCKILVENQGQAMDVAAKIKFHWNKQAYVYVPWPEQNDKHKVSLRLQSLKLDEERSSENKKGALRTIELKWKSNLFFCTGLDDENIAKLTEKIRIYLNEDDSIELLKDEELIKIIK